MRSARWLASLQHTGAQPQPAFEPKPEPVKTCGAPSGENLHNSYSDYSNSQASTTGLSMSAPTHKAMSGGSIYGTIPVEPEPEDGIIPVEPEPEEPLTDNQVIAAFELYDANHGKLREDPQFKDCVPGTFVDHFRMCELDNGVLDRYQALKPKTISVVLRGELAPIEVPWHEGMPTKEVKEFLERPSPEGLGISKYQQRLMHGETELKALNRESGGFHQLPDSVVPGDTTLQLISTYNDVAGRSKIEGVAKDAFGNALGAENDLGVDGAFEGLNVMVIQLYPFDMKNPLAAMKQKGFEVSLHTTVMPAEQLRAELRTTNQLWLISTNSNKLGADHVAAIKEFFDAGRGVYIFGDNDPYYADANAVSLACVGGAEQRGNVHGCHTVKLQSAGAAPIGSGPMGDRPWTGPPGFAEHLMFTGMEALYEGETVSTIQKCDELKPLMYGSAGNLMCAVYDKGGKRMVIDTGFTRLFCKWDDAGTARYIINSCVWLVNMENDW